MEQKKHTLAMKWGVPEWDEKHYVQVPRPFLKYAAKIGLTHREILFIIHLADFHYGYAYSDVRPSQGTIAERMGISRKSVSEIVQSLRRKGMQIQCIPGKTCIYDLSSISQKIQKSATCEEIVTPTCEETVTGGVKKPLHEKDNNKEIYIDSAPVSAALAKKEDFAQRLQELGVKEYAARSIAETHTREELKWIIEKLEHARKLRDPTGYAIYIASHAETEAPRHTEPDGLWGELIKAGVKGGVAKQCIEIHGEAKCREALAHMRERSHGSEPHTSVFVRLLTQEL